MMVDDLRSDGRPGKRVVIVGGGLAGLSAAYQLRAGGHDVKVLEARLRPGGRVHTVRSPFADDLYAEAGAFFFPSNHEHLMKYVRLFELELDPVPPRDLGSLCYVRGRRMVADAAGEYGRWPLDLRLDEHRVGLAGMLRRYVGSVTEGTGDVSQSAWPPDELRRFDSLSMSEFLEQQGASLDAQHLLNTMVFSFWAGVGEDVSALFLLQQYPDVSGFASEDGASPATESTIRGGSDLLPKALAAELGEVIVYGAAAVAIEHTSSNATVVFRQRNSQHRVQADHVVCAVPFSCLRRIEITPPLSPKKRFAIENLRSTSVAHVFLQTSRRFWRAEGSGGPALGPTDLPIGAVRDATHNQPGTRGILDAMTLGRHAQAFAAMAPEERIEYATVFIDRVFPGARKDVQGGHWFNWDAEPWSRGDYAWYKPSEFLQIYPYVAPPEGRLHFAGDHTSHRSAWQDGAISSGHRVAREIHQPVRGLLQ